MILFKSLREISRRKRDLCENQFLVVPKEANMVLGHPGYRTYALLKGRFYT